MKTYLKKILQLLDKKQKRKMWVIGGLMLIGGFFESLSASLMLPLISAIMETDGWNKKWYAEKICSIFNINNQANYVEFLIVALAFLFLFKNAFIFFEYYIQYSFTSKSKYKTKKDLFHKYVNRQYKFFLTANSGEIIRIIASDSVESFSAVENFLSICTEATVSIILGITIFAMSPIIALALLAIIGIEMLIIFGILKPVMRKIGERRRLQGAMSYKWVIQAINGIKSIIVSTKQPYFEKNFSKYEGEVTESERKHLVLSSLPRLVIEAFTISGILVILLIMVKLGMDLKLIVPQLSAFVVAAMRLLPSVNRISSSFNQLQYQEGAVTNVLSVLKSDLLDEEKSVLSEKSEDLKFEKTLELRNVSFAYDDSDENVLDNISLSIISGQSVGIIGPSGAGKTTLVDIILGILKPKEGMVLCDDKNVFEHLHAWRENIAYVPQQIFLLDASIRENILFGAEAGSDEQIWEVIKETELFEFVSSLPAGLDTIIGEQGVRLSGGQRQRIGVARALFLNPKILFFDEATSALDNETERSIMESINLLKGKKTMVIIAHRLTTIENCDVIFKVENKKVKEVDKLHY